MEVHRVMDPSRASRHVRNYASCSVADGSPRSDSEEGRVEPIPGDQALIGAAVCAGHLSYKLSHDYRSPTAPPMGVG